VVQRVPPLYGGLWRTPIEGYAGGRVDCVQVVVRGQR